MKQFSLHRPDRYWFDNRQRRKLNYDLTLLRHHPAWHILITRHTWLLSIPFPILTVMIPSRVHYDIETAIAIFGVRPNIHALRYE